MTALKKIQRFADQESMNRDKKLESCPITKYEQDKRQEGIREMLDAKTEDLILDLGCGSARDLSLLAETVGESVGLDLSKGMLLEGNKKLDGLDIKSVHFILGNGATLPFSNGVFDKIICSEVIEHVPNYEDSIKEMVRVLKNNGRLIITTPNKTGIYGLTRKCIETSISLVAKILRTRRKVGHPYDEWKTQSELMSILSKHDINVNVKLGLCFIPGQITYYFPRSFKALTVCAVTLLEKHVRYKLNRYGYMIGLSGEKSAASY